MKRKAFKLQIYHWKAEMPDYGKSVICFFNSNDGYPNTEVFTYDEGVSFAPGHEPFCWAYAPILAESILSTK